MKKSVLELEICFNCHKVLSVKESIVESDIDRNPVSNIDYFSGIKIDKKCDSCNNNLGLIKTSPRDTVEKTDESLVIFNDPPSMSSDFLSGKWKVPEETKKWLKGQIHKYIKLTPEVKKEFKDKAQKKIEDSRKLRA